MFDNYGIGHPPDQDKAAQTIMKMTKEAAFTCFWPLQLGRAGAGS